MSSSGSVLVARPSGVVFVGNVVTGLIFGAIGVGGLVEGKVLGLVFAVPAAYLLLNLRRRVTVLPDRLVAQGRLARREVQLREVTQVALSRTMRPWVASTARRPFFLHMVYSGTVDEAEFVTRLRQAASDAGAHLEPAPEGLSSPEKPDAWFSS